MGRPITAATIVGLALLVLWSLPAAAEMLIDDNEFVGPLIDLDCLHDDGGDALSCQLTAGEAPSEVLASYATNHPTCDGLYYDIDLCLGLSTAIAKASTAGEDMTVGAGFDQLTDGARYRCEVTLARGMDYAAGKMLWTSALACYRETSQEDWSVFPYDWGVEASAINGAYQINLTCRSGKLSVTFRPDRADLEGAIVSDVEELGIAGDSSEPPPYDQIKTALFREGRFTVLGEEAEAMIQVIGAARNYVDVGVLIGGDHARAVGKVQFVAAGSTAAANAVLDACPGR